MSDLNTTAEAMGVPADIVRRSADARATANGISTDEILDAWGGGGTVAAPPPPQPAAEPDAAGQESESATQSDLQPEPVVSTPSPAPAAPAMTPGQAVAPSAAASGEPPVLVGAKDNPWAVLVGAVGLFVAVVLLGLVGPALPVDTPGARTGAIAFSDSAEAGQDLYTSLGCAACHTQMIRPVVADVGLGPVTLNDTDQVLGTRRFGPDLAEVGARFSELQLQAVVERSDTHPNYNLSNDDLADLDAYLLESTTASGGG